jgi:NAD(P)H-hydrate epimerase
MNPRYPVDRKVTRQEMQRIDAEAIRRIGIPAAALMESAGRAVAEVAFEMMPRGGATALVCCGSGSNGGDGLVAARYLHNWGVAVVVVLVGRSPAPDSDAGVYLEVVRRMGLPLEEIASREQLSRFDRPLSASGLVVDALLGTGFSEAAGPVREPAAGVIGRINASGKSVLAVDVPSGLDCDTGRAAGIAVRASCTVTMGLAKIGFDLADGPRCVGRVHVADLGFPIGLLFPQGK